MVRKKCYCCGATLAETANFCRRCGKATKITDALVQAALAGRGDAQEELYYRTQEAVYGQIRAKVSDEDVANDLLQDTYMRAFQNLHQLQEAEAFPGWLMAIARNLTVDWYRKNGKQVQTTQFSQLDYETEDNISAEESLLLQAETNAAYLPDVSLDQAETGRLLDQIMKALPAEQRMVLMMRYWEQLSLQEIADTLGENLSTVKTRLTAAKKKVAVQVKELERQGTKLYSLAPFPFFIWLLWQAKEIGAGTAEQAAASAGAAAVEATSAQAASGAARATSGATAAQATARATKSSADAAQATSSAASATARAASANATASAATTAETAYRGARTAAKTARVAGQAAGKAVGTKLAATVLAATLVAGGTTGAVKTIQARTEGSTVEAQVDLGEKWGITEYEASSLTSTETSSLFAELPYAFYSDFGGNTGYISLYFSEDGSFSGNYWCKDSTQTGTAYPIGTISRAAYSGTFGQVQQLDDSAYLLLVKKAEISTPVDTEKYFLGFRYKYADAFSLEAEDAFVLFLPGTSVSQMTALVSGLEASDIPYTDALPTDVYGLYQCQTGLFLISDASIDESDWQIFESFF